jgi:hypothetical protein
MTRYFINTDSGQANRAKSGWAYIPALFWPWWGRLTKGEINGRQEFA